ncbi:anaerobic sulfite reductase subunit AsrB [Candidatus Woesearchaeota archaeon]|nr:anaerobic sulfite reductase subunit AsrB [Candidatus Woesearchaeota archaeon]
MVVSREPRTTTYTPREARIISCKQLTSDTYLYTIKNVFNKKILPGQFVEISVLGVGEAPISVCNYDEETIDLLIRSVGNVTSHLVKLKPKQKMLVRGPYGNGYPLDDLKKQNLVIIGGGTGVAPPRSVIEYVLENKKDYAKTSIFLGFRSPKDVLFKEDIVEWKKSLNTYVTVDKGDKTWKEDVGVITTLLDKYKIPSKAKFILCGPPIMIKFAVQKILEKKYLEQDIYVSFERNMKCGVEKCGHCMIHGNYVCTDGPVFKWDKAKKFQE